MRAVAISAVMLFSSAAVAEDGWFVWREPNAAETVALVAADVAITIDVMQSMDIKHHPGMVEGNPLLGKHPSDARLIVTGSVFAMVAMSAGWYVLPSRWRAILPAAVFGAETAVVISNHQAGLRIGF